MARVAAVLPGYASVKRAAEVLHLAPRSVRDVIYAGRLPSVRIGRQHFVRAADLETERRRRLGLRLPARAGRARTHGSRAPRQRPAHHPVDPAVRQQRAAEREAMVSRWAERHDSRAPRLPFAPGLAAEPASCSACKRAIPSGGRMVAALPDAAPLCPACGRRALLDWADRRRLEAAAARRLAHDLSEAYQPGDRPPASLAA